ncbi:MAG: rod shape-determining protein RodA [Alphaproteobacteria bacterium]|nr:rod shape-determining protein RodA [Alphaproteobacteria bacterium]MBV9063867.1 rod shape-determining protein RodA [Alphaproteobacteria bacterium]
MSVRHYAAVRGKLPLREKFGEFNWPFVLVIGVIACIGFAMLYSVAGGHFSPWASKQMLRFCIGMMILCAVAVVDLRVWMTLAYPFYALCLLLLIAVQVAGHTGLGAQRWIDLGPIQIQPSELMKIALILALARYLHGLDVEDVSKPLRLIIPLAMIGVPTSLVLMQPNLGTATILVMDGASLLFLAGLSWWWIVPTISAVAAAVPVAWQFLHDYQKRRVLTFLNPQKDALGAGWNISQAEIAIGSGGVTGKGFLHGTQSQLNFLPEKETDFIFTSVGEEFGLLGCIALLLLFAVVIGYGIRIAMSSRSHFGRLVALGLSLNVFFYIMINGAMVMGLIPVVGIPMPLLSYGGTALLTVMFGFGLIMSVYVHRQVEIPRHSGILL